MRGRCPGTAESRRETGRSTPRNRAKSRWPSGRGEPGSPWSGGLRLSGVHREPLAGRERDGQRLVAAERDELPADAVETHHLAEVNVDEPAVQRSEEHTSELQSLMRISYAVFCLKKKKKAPTTCPREIHPA